MHSFIFLVIIKQPLLVQDFEFQNHILEHQE